MPEIDDLRSDLKSERIQLGSEPFSKELDDLEDLLTGQDPEVPADAEPRTYTTTSPRAAVALAAYLSQVAEDLGRESNIHLRGSLVTVGRAASSEEGDAVFDAGLDTGEPSS